MTIMTISTYAPPANVVHSANIECAGARATVQSVTMRVSVTVYI